MKLMKEFDIAIIGAGASGLAAATRAADCGAGVCLIEKASVGGVYLHDGFYVLRMLLNSLGIPRRCAPALEEELGIGRRPAVGGAGCINVPATLRKVREGINALVEKRRKSLDARGVALISGTGEIVSLSKILVKSAEGGEQVISARKIILAMGSTPKALPAMPYDGKAVISSDDLLKLPDLPQQILIVGVGAFACEIAVLLNKLGCKVFICSEEPRIVQGQDPDITSALEEELKKQKVKLLLNKSIVSIYKDGEKVDVTLDGGVKFSVNLIMVAGVRKPDSGMLLAGGGLGIRTGEQGEIWVNEKMETALSGVYAVGSITGGRHSASLAEEEARVAVANALGAGDPLSKDKSLDKDKVPTIIYSDPELASVGCFASEAHFKGYRAVEGRYDLEELNPALFASGMGGILKIVVDKPSKKIIGGHVLSPQASELVTLIALAVRKGLTLGDLSNLSYGRPSPYQAIHEVARSISKSLKSPTGS